MKGKVPGIIWRGRPGKLFSPPQNVSSEFIVRLAEFMKKASSHRIAPATYPRLRFSTFTEGQMNLFPSSRQGKLSFVIDLGCPRNANEHDHNFGILLLRPAASNECRRIVQCQQASKGLTSGNRVSVWRLETFAGF
jgi:hypothetical protein